MKVTVTIEGAPKERWSLEQVEALMDALIDDLLSQGVPAWHLADALENGSHVADEEVVMPVCSCCGETCGEKVTEEKVLYEGHQRGLHTHRYIESDCCGAEVIGGEE